MGPAVAAWLFPLQPLPRETGPWLSNQRTGFFGTLTALFLFPYAMSLFHSQKTLTQKSEGWEREFQQLDHPQLEKKGDGQRGNSAKLSRWIFESVEGGFLLSFEVFVYSPHGILASSTNRSAFKRRMERRGGRGMRREGIGLLTENHLNSTTVKKVWCIPGPFTCTHCRTRRLELCDSSVHGDRGGCDCEISRQEFYLVEQLSPAESWRCPSY